jgi:putative endonuclease
MAYYVYILKCADDSLYTGITTDLERRLNEHHNEGKAGAKYTRSRRPVRVVYSKLFKTRSKASVKEYEIKNFSRDEKLALVRTSC